jgi:hypothetical protein
MKSLLTVSLILIASISIYSQDRDHGVHIGLLYPLSTHGTEAATYSNYFSLHGIAGVSRGEKGFAAAGFANIIREDARGFQVAGFFNHIGGFSEGFKVAGFTNIYHSAKGFQAAGFTNISQGSITGLQISGFMNKVDNLHGYHLAGYLNLAKDVRGAQTAGFLNIASDVEGAQVAGFINIASKVKGVQIAGFINVADSSEYPIGLINIIRNGEKWLGVTTDDNLTTLATLRSGSRKMYGIIGVGYNFRNDEQVFAYQTGIGANFFSLNNFFRLKTEATWTSLEDFEGGIFGKASLTLLPSLRLGSHIEIFGGPSVNYVNTNTIEGKKMIDNYMWSDIDASNHLKGIYVGYTAGIHMGF